MKEKKQLKSRSPWSWIPTLYFAEGLPYVVVMTVAGIMYKRMGVSNTEIALYTSWLYLPWVIKPFWSPFVDLLKTKRWWIISMQLLIGAGLAGVGFLIPVPFFFQATLAVFWLMAFSSATHDIAADGFYMLALDSNQQSFFVGIRSTFYRLSMIAGQGLLIILAGGLETFTGLEPVEFHVQSSNTEQTITEHKADFAPSITDKSTFVAFPENLVLSTNKITADSLQKIKQFAEAENKKNGFIPTRETNTTSSNSTELVGNTGIISVKLNKQPEEGKEIILNTGFLKGDKSISLISGERFTFTSENWDKSAYIVVQLDSKLTSEISAEFKGTSGNIKLAWSITFFILAGVFILLFVYHRFILPYPSSDKASSNQTSKEILQEFGHTFVSFFKKKHIITAMAFMLLYRLGEAFLVKMASIFLIDSREMGGLGLTTGQVGITYGTIGVICLTLGGILGGIAASRKGLKYWLWPMALSITLPNLAYVYLAYFQPDSLLLINIAVGLEQFGYGFGFTAYMLYLIYFSDGEHKTAHYAFCTGLMALGMMLPGMAAGWLQELLGYDKFFLLVLTSIVPTLTVIPFVKVDKNFGKK